MDADHGSIGLAGAPLPPIRVMIVDDDLFVRSHLSELLPRVGNVTISGVFTSGADGVAGIAIDPPDVVLMDIAMVPMDGIEATRRIHRLHPLVKVLALTSLADLAVVARMRAAGAAGFLFKDTPVVAMARAIEATHHGLLVMSDGALDRPIADRAPALAQLNETEFQILKLVCQGLTNGQIATAVSLAPSTVKHYISTLMQRLGVTNRTMLAIGAGPYLRAHPERRLDSRPRRDAERVRED